MLWREALAETRTVTLAESRWDWAPITALLLARNSGWLTFYPRSRRPRRKWAQGWRLRDYLCWQGD